MASTDTPAPRTTRGAPEPAPTGPAASRLDRLDALRGTAVVWMTLFHFAFDLAHFGLWPQDFYRDPVWTVQRSCIVSLFLFCGGLSQAVALWGPGEGGSPLRPLPPLAARFDARFWRRWAQIAGCALLVTAGSWFMFPRSFIYFGVLHAIAVMLIVARLSAGWGRGLWVAAAVALALKFGAAWAHGQGWMPAWLDDKVFNWLGLISRKPITEDYVPLVPWLAAVWAGLAAGRWVLRRRRPHWLVGSAPAPLAWLGRWSLSWYMLHQPVLIGSLMLWQATMRA